MNKLQTEVHHLQRYEHSERDQQILEGIAHYGSVSKLLKNSSFKKRTVQRRLAAMRKHAQKYGMHEEHPDAHTILDQPIRGKSRLRKFDPPLPDGTVLQWDKSKAEDAHLLEAIQAHIDGMHVEPAKPKKCNFKTTSEVLPILTIADAHLGLLAYEGETGSDWNLRDSLNLLKVAVTTLIDKMEHVPLALLVDVGDMTHTDGLVSATPKNKNPLDSSDRYFPMCRAASELMCFTIDLLLEKAEYVNVMSVRGNHNDVTAWHVNEKMIAYYKDEPRVYVETNDAYTLPYVWEKNLIVVTHGDAAKNEKMYQYVTAKWSEAFGTSNYSYVIKGHTHHCEREAIANMMFETHSTLTKSDAYHEFKMYKSMRSMNLVNLHPDGGEDSRHTFIPRFGQ